MKNKVNLNLKRITMLITAPILAVSIMFGASLGTSAESEYYKEDGFTHTELDFAQIQYEGYDPKRLEAIIDEFKTALAEEGNDENVCAYYENILNELDILTTQRDLNAIRYYSDVNNEEYERIDSEFNEMTSDLVDKSAQAVRNALVDSNYSETLKNYINDQDMVDAFLEYEDLTDRERELITEENNLVQEYNKAHEAEYSVDIDGTTWTLNKLYEESYNMEYDEYYNIYVELTKAKNEVCGEIYLKLVKIKNEQAQINGYDNYADYAYAETYSRDFTTDDTKYLYKEVKEHFVPLVQTVAYSASTYSIGEDLYFMDYLTGESMVEAIEPYIGKISPALNESFDYLKNHHTYDLDISEKKMPLGYTTTFYQYGMPFIFNSSDGNYNDYETLIHEYGHYNNAYHNSYHAITDSSNVDVAEIHSQGMELLFLEYADKIYGKENADAVRLALLYNIAASVTEGCLYDEFQVNVYKADKELTLHDLNKLFREMSEEYGYIYRSDTDEAYGWVEVTHTFQTPMYYLGYATSALSAMDIFGMALENRQNAVDCYMNLTTYGLDTSYRELIDDVGLQDIFEGDAVEIIAGEAQNYVDNIVRDIQRAETVGQILFYAVILLIVLLIVVTVIVIIKRIKRKKAAEKETERNIVTYEEE